MYPTMEDIYTSQTLYLSPCIGYSHDTTYLHMDKIIPASFMYEFDLYFVLLLDLMICFTDFKTFLSRAVDKREYLMIIFLISHLNHML